jgi:hypothetical protein
LRSRRDHHLGCCHHVLCAIRPQAKGGQTTPLIAVEIELQHLNRLTDNTGFAWHRDLVLGGLPEGPKLFGLSTGVRRDLIDEVVQFTVPVSVLHLRFPSGAFRPAHTVASGRADPCRFRQAACALSWTSAVSVWLAVKVRHAAPRPQSTAHLHLQTSGRSRSM